MNKFRFLSIFLLISGITFANGDIAQGKIKSVLCIACHGIDGNSLVPNFPKIAGQNETYLANQLKQFKSGKRADEIMAGMVATLNNQDIQNLSAYFASQVNKPINVKKNASLAQAEKLYKGGDKDRNITACIACHGIKADGIPSAGFPSLASQYPSYTAKQLKAFRQVSINTQTDGKEAHRIDDNKMMVSVTKDLSNKEINALSEYIATLH